MTTTRWVSHRRWSLAHCVDTLTEHEFRGHQHAKTVCGRTVRVDDLSADGQQDRCKRCGLGIAP